MINETDILPPITCIVFVDGFDMNTTFSGWIMLRTHFLYDFCGYHMEGFKKSAKLWTLSKQGGGGQGNQLSCPNPIRVSSIEPSIIASLNQIC